MLEAALTKSIGVLKGVQWLLRHGDADSRSDDQMADMLDLVNEDLTTFLPTTEQPT